MDKIVIDGKLIKTKRDFYDEMNKYAYIVPHMGHNLDALNDVLRQGGIESVTFVNFDSLKENLGKYADRIVDVVKYAAKLSGFRVEVRS